MPTQTYPSKSLFNPFTFAGPDITRFDDIDLNIHLLDEMWTQPVSVAQFQLISINPTYVTSVEPSAKPKSESKKFQNSSPDQSSKKRRNNPNNSNSPVFPSTSTSFRNPSNHQMSLNTKPSNVLNVGCSISTGNSSLLPKKPAVKCRNIYM